MRSEPVRTSGHGYGRAMGRLTGIAIALAPLPPLVQRPAPAGSHVVVFTAHDYAYEGPDSVPAGLTTLIVRNKGKEDHELILVRLDGKKTLGDLLAALTTPSGPDAAPSWATAVGGPGEAVPGGESNATLLLAPGHYVVVCGVPASDEKSHFMKGMMRDLTVTPATGTASRIASLPEGEVTITMVDDSFHVAGPLSAGSHTFRVTNAGKQGHMMEMVRLAPGKTIADVGAWDPASKMPKPIEWSGGAAYMAPGSAVYFTAHFTPGVYGVICFIDDANDHKPHFMHGMQKQFTVS